MNKKLESIFFSLPVFIQNAMVTVYGYTLKNERYGSAADHYVKEILETENLNKEEMRELQNIKFVEMARHAIKTVPYYQSWAKSNDINEDEIQSLDDLSVFPIITKDILRGNIDIFRSRAFEKKNLIKLNTSGSTGSPITIYTDINSRTHHYAFFTRLRTWFGITSDDWRATLFGRIICKPGQSSPPFWRYDYFQRNVLFSSYHLSEKNLRSYYEKLKSLNPAEIIGYPSSIFLIAKYMKNNNLDRLYPKVIFTTAETLLSHQREIIEEQFNCPVIDQYGCTEMAFFASQCEYGNMHYHPEHGYVELVNNRYESISDGDVGIALCTGFVNKAMPLIRYEVGDVINSNDNVCQCNRPFPVITSIEGRKDDILVMPDKRPLGRMDPIFKGLRGIYETQIIQEKPDTLIFKIVKSSDYSESIEKELLYEIRKRTGSEMKIEIQHVINIDKDKNGKFKSVIKKF